MYKEPTPTAFYFVKMFPMEWNAWTNDLHITFTFVPQWLARTERDAMFVFQYNFLLEQKIPQLNIRGEFETQRFYDLSEEIMQSFLS
jgi:hypothetical protein